MPFAVQKNYESQFYIQDSETKTILYNDGVVRGTHVQHDYPHLLFFVSRKEANAALRINNEHVATKALMLESEEFVLSETDYQEAIKDLREKGLVV